MEVYYGVETKILNNLDKFCISKAQKEQLHSELQKTSVKKDGSILVLCNHPTRVSNSSDGHFVAFHASSPAWTKEILSAGMSGSIMGTLSGTAWTARLCVTEQTACRVSRGQHLLLEGLSASQIRVSGFSSGMHLFARAVHGWHLPGYWPPSSGKFPLGRQLEGLCDFLPLIRHTDMKAFPLTTAWPTLKTEPSLHHPIPPRTDENVNISIMKQQTVISWLQLVPYWQEWIQDCTSGWSDILINRVFMNRWLSILASVI